MKTRLQVVAKRSTEPSREELALDALKRVREDLQRVEQLIRSWMAKDPDVAS